MAPRHSVQRHSAIIDIRWTRLLLGPYGDSSVSGHCKNNGAAWQTQNINIPMAWFKVAGVKVYLRQAWNFRSHAVSACLGLWHCMHLTGLCMHELHALPHDITGQCMQLLHGLCCFDFVSDIPLSPATLDMVIYFLIIDTYGLNLLRIL
jgi:hypothetical protein